MSEQDATQSSVKRRRSRKSNTANQENGKQAPAVQRPAIDDREVWKTYWKEQGQSWRREPEIDEDRQKFLDERRSIVPDIQKGIYPFKGIKLGRADVEWLLATHENGRGPVDWSDGSHRGLAARRGLDLRAAELQFADLSRLPLTNMQGGLSGAEWVGATKEQRQMAAVHLEGTNLRAAHLEGASFSYAHLEGARLHEAHLEGADLYRSHLEGKYITRTDERRLERLQGNTLTKLPSTDLAEAFFNAETKLDRSTIGDEQQVGIRVGGAHWGGVDVTAVEWKSIKMLGDEYVARQPCYQDGKAKTKDRRLLEYQRATEANRQLAAVLQSQGLHEEADQFAYRAQKLQREVWRREHRYVKYIGSWFLYLLAGYGYRPLISIIIYLLVVFGFAVGYYQIWATNHLERVTKQTLSSVGAVIFSITAFHGRGFFLGSSGLGYDSLITILGAVEAVIGLIIELSFIATFTRRFLGK